MTSNSDLWIAMTFKSNENPMFRSKFSEDIFKQKYAHQGCHTWADLAKTLVDDVCGEFLPKDELDDLTEIITDLKFIPGGRYLYYAGRPSKFFNNCYLLKAEEDSREDWANLSWKSESCLMTGGGIGIDYSVYRPEGAGLSKTGGLASGPIPKMQMINEIGRRVMQGGSRRSAIYASLNWKHRDIETFLSSKNWYDMPVGSTGLSIGEIKEQDFNFAAPLDMTNISVNYDTEWLLNYWNTGDVGDVFKANVRQALSTAEPGFSFNFFDKENETLRNACTEVVSDKDSDVCNLGSCNLGRIDNLEDFKKVVTLATKFLLCGTVKAELPYEKVYEVRQKYRRLGLGLMGMHEWLIKRGSRYEVTPELHRWLRVYKSMSDATSSSFANTLSVSVPVANRAIAPTGSIGILAGTSTGVEPIFAVAYKRRYLKNGTKWHYQYVVDSAAQELIDLYGTDPENIESALDLAGDYKRRIKFQADVQDYVDMSISSTINLPQWGSKENNEDTVSDFAATLADHAHRLRGFTVYPDGCRGGQPLTPVPYSDAVGKLGEVFEESIETHDICDITGHGGSCGV
jgi:ribonucleoside-diphosphate reductase alpha chain